MRLFFTSEFHAHTPPPGHPERPERADVFAAVAKAFAAGGGAVDTPRAATRDEVTRIHSPQYLDVIAATAGRPLMLDPDTFTSPRSYEVALLAAGATVQAAAHVLETGESALAMVRPPGHHAEPERAMGFCLFNNIAIAAAAVRAAGVARVAIVDIDVHHGNGTQAAFYSDPAVLFISSHQYPFYPGTGAATESGAGEGRGFTVNLPLDAGTTDAQYASVYESRVVPALEQYKPEIVLISAGFDAHERDPLAGMRMTTAGYVTLVQMLDATARRVSGRGLALVTEGGYHLEALRECLEGTIGALS